MSSSILLKAGCISLIISLTLAWLTTLTRHLKIPIFTRIFVSDSYLLKSHIDFLLMSILLMVFSIFKVEVYPFIIVSTIIGSFMNPLSFLVLSIKPEINKSPTSIFGIYSSISYILTTVGYIGLSLESISMNL